MSFFCMTAVCTPFFFFFFFNDTATTEIYTLSLHDALPIFLVRDVIERLDNRRPVEPLLHDLAARSEEHTSELQSRRDLVCRLLLEKKKKEYSMLLEACAEILRIHQSAHACDHDSARSTSFK